MPNWCNNSIEIVGPREKIRALWDQARKEGEEGGLLQAMHPMPLELNITAGWLGEGTPEQAAAFADLMALEAYRRDLREQREG